MYPSGRQGNQKWNHILCQSGAVFCLPAMLLGVLVSCPRRLVPGRIWTAGTHRRAGGTAPDREESGTGGGPATLFGKRSYHLGISGFPPLQRRRWKWK